LLTKTKEIDEIKSGIDHRMRLAIAFSTSLLERDAVREAVKKPHETESNSALIAEYSKPSTRKIGLPNALNKPELSAMRLPQTTIPLL
jgi:hypothetical protein